MMPTASTATRRTRSASPAAKPSAIASKAAAKTVTAHKVQQRKMPVLGQEQREHYVKVAAYYIAERRGFDGDRALDDWLQAETEVDRLLGKGSFSP